MRKLPGKAFLLRRPGGLAFNARMSAAPLRLTALLFTPGSRPDRFARAAECGADGSIIDLEDSVAEPDKARVRREVLAGLKEQGRVGAPPCATGIRINSLRTKHGLADLDALNASGLRPDFVMLPKVESAMEVQQAAAKLPGSVRLICLIETILGVRFVADIAGASPRVSALAFGGLDLSAETGGEPVWDALLAPRTAVVHACAAVGITALDQPFIDFEDAKGLVAECAATRSLGYTGKLAIHPRQCAVIRKAYLPTAAQVRHAKKVVAAYDAARGHVAVVDGKMIDVPIYRAARRVLDRAGE
jgi:citrate lyase beta subunit